MRLSQEAKAILLGVFSMIVSYLVFAFTVQPLFEPDQTTSFEEQMVQYQFLFKVQMFANVVFNFVPGLVAGAVYGRRGLTIGAAAGLVAALVCASILMLFIDARISLDVFLQHWNNWLPRIMCIVVGSAIGGIVGVIARNRLLPSNHSLQARRP